MLSVQYSIRSWFNQWVGLVHSGWSTGRARANATVQAVWRCVGATATACAHGGCAPRRGPVRKWTESNFGWTGEYEYLARLDLARK